MSIYKAYQNHDLLHAEDFKKMLIGASTFFSRKIELINSLNVFPVPDGDTGSNMNMTLVEAADGCRNYRGASIGELSAVVAKRALMGARGNSGVILSQFLRGLARGLKGKLNIRPCSLSKAFQYGVVYAYKAVSRPVEGTILTVSREMARGARSAARRGADLNEVLEEAIRGGREALKRTTDQLPALKEAGVVDAGGMGLVVFLEGCRLALQRSPEDLLDTNLSAAPPEIFPRPETPYSPLHLVYPYCAELLLKTEAGPDLLRPLLEQLGDSLLVVSDGSIVKIHLHTAALDQVLKICLAYGTLHDIKIENMYDQHSQFFQNISGAEKMITFPAASTGNKNGRSGIIAVSFGEGFRDLFLNLGAEEVVFGGQTMNPKVEDLLLAAQNLSGNQGIILPNNKNIIMVAQQVPPLSSKEVTILQTRTLPQGLAALLAYNQTLDLDENLMLMEKAAARIKSGEVTYATRSTRLNGSTINEGDFLGLQEGHIRNSGKDLSCTTLDLITAMIESDDELITIFYGQDVPETEALLLAQNIERDLPGVEVELKYGGQPIYYYIIAIE